jgi:hypothetical protein
MQTIVYLLAVLALPQADGVRLPFRTRIHVPGATITYTVASVRHNEPVQDAVFRRPRAQ